ncbi:hypothetical protein CTI14_46085 [Methylobacterium radiotolerans]|nr:hypothetical protein CTI14_46085 [Methylobacterium radiotolerans]
MQDAFHARNALQCGYCTPGMLVTAAELLEDADAATSRDAIRAAIAGNYCRCTGCTASAAPATISWTAGRCGPA